MPSASSQPHQPVSMPDSARARAALLLLLGAALILYLATLDNGLRPGELAGGDLITHQYAQVQGRPSNAPGYPLYTMGGWAWFHGLRAILGPTSNPTAILSAYSTLWALVALALLYALILALTARWPLAALAGAFYAVTYFFWYYAASTEQYTSAVALTVAIALLALRWEEAIDAGEARRADRLLLALAFLCGLILAHLVTVAFIVPPLLWFLLTKQPELLRRPRRIAAAIGLAILPLASYAFVFVRGAQHPEWRGQGQWPSTWAWFWDFLSTQQGRDELTWSLHPLWTAEFPSLIWGEVTWIVLLGGLAGLLLLGRRRGIFLGATLAIYLLFSFVDRLGNWYQVIMPAYALLVASAAIAAHRLWRRLAGSRRRRPGQALLLLALAALVLVRLAWSLPRADQRDRPEDTALAPGQAILADDPPPNAAILGVHQETLSLRYLTDIWGRRPDVDAVDSLTAAQVLAGSQRPLLVTDAALPILWQEVRADAHLNSAGRGLILVSDEPRTTMPNALEPVPWPVGDGLELAGYRVSPAADGWQVRLAWRAIQAAQHDWSVSVRPTADSQLLPAAGGDAFVQIDQPHPVHGAYPTSRWLPGEVVVDDYFLPLAAGQAFDSVQVVVYRQLAGGGFEDLARISLPAHPLNPMAPRR